MIHSPWARRLLNLVGPFLGLIIVLSLFSWLTYEPDRPFVYLSAENIKKVSLQTTVLATCGLGMTLVIISGGIDLSIGSIVALSNVVVVLVMNGRLAEQTREAFFRGQNIYAIATAVIPRIDKQSEFCRPSFGSPSLGDWRPGRLPAKGPSQPSARGRWSAYSAAGSMGSLSPRLASFPSSSPSERWRSIAAPSFF